MRRYNIMKKGIIALYLTLSYNYDRVNIVYKIKGD